MSTRTIATLALTAVTLMGCEKGTATAEPVAAAVAEDAHPCDEATTLLVTALQKGDFEGLATNTADPLTHDLSQAEFDDLSAIVQWLGPLHSRTVADHDDSFGGGVRSYAMQFDRGDAVELEVSIAAGGKLVGFEFAGKGYTEAERGVLAEPWREFKVYDFHFLDPDGNVLPEGAPIAGKKVDYEIVVGGIEALLGGHHLSVEKIVFDKAGTAVFREPIEFDTKFDADAMGVPRGSVRGYVEVPGPGQWKIDLRITDENAHRDIEHQQSFETVAG
ncbi:MAG: hypothetical protein ACRBN8_43990 [Nannocystales bacterium]